MFNFLKSDILKILDVTQDERDALFSHKIYNSINNIDDLHIFMENHIFAVWDFMSILKTLQKELTCTDVPWAPKGGGTPARLLNEIVTEEESDIDIYGDYRSHFEMYYQAMNEAGANTKKIESFFIFFVELLALEILVSLGISISKISENLFILIVS